MGNQTGISQRHLFLHKRIEFKYSRSRYNNISLERDWIARKETQTLEYDYRKKQWNVFVVRTIYYGSRWFLFTKFNFINYSSLSCCRLPLRQNMWIVNYFIEHEKTAISHEEIGQFIELS